VAGACSFTVSGGEAVFGCSPIKPVPVNVLDIVQVRFARLGSGFAVKLTKFLLIFFVGDRPAFQAAL
jgi:hypothetical protein